MSASLRELGIDRLAVEDRLSLIEEIWQTICDDASAFPSDAQRAELDRRVMDDDRYPQDTIAWDDVKQSLRASLER